MPRDVITVQVDRARALLAQADSATDAKKVADLARAAEVYAERQKLGQEAITYAHGVVVDAKTLMGELLRETPRNGGGRPLKTCAQVEQVSPPTLAEQGIDRKSSAEAQALARLKEQAPKAHEAVRAGTVSVAQAVADVRRAERAQRREATLRARADGAPAALPPCCRFLPGDCLEALRAEPAGCARLVFADPPYNIGVDYGNGVARDRLPDDVYVAWCRSWFDLVYRALAPDGTFWLLCDHKYADLLAVELRSAGFHRRAWVTWYETFGTYNSANNNFSRTSRPLLYCVKDLRRFVFHPEAARVPSARQVVYDDPRADPRGKVLGDVWSDIPRLAGTHAERLPGFPTQLPVALLTRIITIATEPGDLVLEPFAGSAPAGVAARRLGRSYLGIEDKPYFYRMALQRLRGEARP
jgi:site-specific DNA-methyltransferase (adenine-specific)